MYNIIKKLTVAKVKIISALLAAVLVCSCTVNGVRVRLEKSAEETETEVINTETPVVSGMKKSYTDELNSQFSDIISEKTESFKQTANKTVQDRNGKAELKIEGEVKFNKKNLLSIVLESYEYTSGLNGSSARCAVTTDVSEEKQIMLCDLFCDDEYRDLLNARLEKLSLSEEYSDIWEKPTITEAQNESFYLSDNGLVIYYQPYELSYYSRGFVEFTIPYSDLYGYLKPEYALLY